MAALCDQVWLWPSDTQGPNFLGLYLCTALSDFFSIPPYWSDILDLWLKEKQGAIFIYILVSPYVLNPHVFSNKTFVC